MCQRIGRPPISTIGLGLISVSSLSRVPSPPARMTHFMKPAKICIQSPEERLPCVVISHVRKNIPVTCRQSDGLHDHSARLVHQGLIRSPCPVGSDNTGRFFEFAKSSNARFWQKKP